MHYSSGPRVIPHPLPEVNFLMVEISTPKPYIFMIRVTRQIKCIIAQAPVSYPTPKPYIFMIKVTRQIKCIIAQAPGSYPHPLPEVNF